MVACDGDDATSAALFTRNALVAAAVEVSREADLVAPARRGGEQRQRQRRHGGAGPRGRGGDGRRGRRRAGRRALPGGRGLDRRDRRAAGHGRRRRAAPAAPPRSSPRTAEPRFSEAIMTSDRWPKRASLEVALGRGPVRLCAQAKGAGMLSPNFATMLCFVQTDALVDAATLDRLLRAAVERSFERVSVDGQLSTNDSVFAIAGGASGVSGRAGQRRRAGVRGRARRAPAPARGRDGGRRRGRRAGRAPRRARRGRGGGPGRARGRQLAAGEVRAARAGPELGPDPAGGRPGGAGRGPVAARALHRRASTSRAPAARWRSPRTGGGGWTRRWPPPRWRCGSTSLRDGEEAEIFFCDLGPEYVRFNSEYTT